MYLIDCKDSGSAPAVAAATVATATSETLAIVAAFVNIAAPLAFDLLDTTQEVCTLECNHKFHLDCLIDWYRRPNSNYKCPNCYVHRDIILIENTKKVVPEKNNTDKYIFKNNKKCVIS